MYIFQWSCFWTFVFLSILFAILFHLPAIRDENNQITLNQYHKTIQTTTEKEIPFSVMSFNVRLDGLEKDANNHFTKRVFRLAKVFEDWDPLIAGLQEPFSGQVMHMLRELPPKYKPIGYRRAGFTHEYQSMGHPTRQNDYQTAILYNSEALEPVYEDHVWLSETPRIEGSKHPTSRGKRTLTFARFQLNPEYFNSTALPATHVLAFNTHLDVWGENARQFQAEKVLFWIKETQKQFPDDPVFLFGDFNSVPGHKSHEILTEYLADSWDTCQASKQCATNEIAITYHHWLGTFVNTYPMRIAQYLLHILHGSGLVVVMDGFNWNQLRNISVSACASILQAFPTSLHRLHVDWILFNNPLSLRTSVAPKLVVVADVRNNDFSSDHFPLVALFSFRPI